jgi:hypothetical protein
VRETRFEGATAMIARGRDTHGYWEPEPSPKVDFDEACIEHMLATRAKFKAKQAEKLANNVQV